MLICKFHKFTKQNNLVIKFLRNSPTYFFWISCRSFLYIPQGVPHEFLLLFFSFSILTWNKAMLLMKTSQMGNFSNYCFAIPTGVPFKHFHQDFFEHSLKRNFWKDPGRFSIRQRNLFVEEFKTQFLKTFPLELQGFLFESSRIFLSGSLKDFFQELF